MAFRTRLTGQCALHRQRHLADRSRWDASKVVRATDAQLAKWSREKVTYYSANHYPT
jgi:hypothetical protein